MKNKKVIILTVIIFISICLLSLVSFLLYKENHDSKKHGTQDLQAYGVVVEKGSNYLLIQGVDDERYYVTGNKDINTGTFVSITYNTESDKEKGNGVVTALLSENEVSILDDYKTTTVAYFDEDEKVTTVTKEKITTTSLITTTKTQKTTYRYTTKVSENEVISYAKNTYNDVQSEGSNLDKAKDCFITLVDFIFYDGEIKGKKFNELTSSAKAKIVYYALLMDVKIDSKWPNYKENIQDKYNDVKEKLIAKYMDLTTSICNSNAKECELAKNDFRLLKESVNLTWNTLKRAFTYAFNKGKNSLAEWYEVFSGKR